MTYSSLVAGDGLHAKVAVVFLHGHGMVAEDFAPFAAALGPAVVVHFVRAPFDAIGGGRAWWPRDPCFAGLRGVPPWDLADERPDGLAQARRDLGGFIRALAATLEGRPIVLMGYSQGGMLACDTFFHDDLPIQGLAALSACRIASRDWASRPPRLAGFPVFIAHGMHDPVLSPSGGEALRDAVAAAGAHVEWLSFEGGHEVPLLVWRRLRNYLQSVTQAHQRPPGERAIVHTHPQGKGEVDQEV